MFVPMAAGVLALVMGVHGSRAANVPNKAAGLTPFALVMAALAAICVGVAVYLGNGMTPVVAVVALPAVLDLLVAYFSRQVQHALDRA
jgi:hypothetical protein